MHGLIVSVFVTSQLAVIGATPIKPNWTSDYGVALKAARNSERPLVVVIENPNDPDKSLDKQELMEAAESAKLLSKYELCRVDVTTKAGKQVAEAFGATQLPYTAVTDKQVKKVVYRKAGQGEPRAWIAMLAAASSPVRRTVSRVINPAQSQPIFNSRTFYFPQNCFT